MEKNKRGKPNARLLDAIQNHNKKLAGKSKSKYHSQFAEGPGEGKGKIQNKIK
jgi:hypothetical protein